MHKMTTMTNDMILIRSAGLPFEAMEPLQHDFAPLFKHLRDLKREADALRAVVLQAMTNALVDLPESPVRMAVYEARRDFYNHRYEGFQRAFNVLAQTNASHPALLLMRSAVLEWVQKNEAQRHAEQEIRETHHTVTRQGLHELQRLAVEHTPLRRALLFASHDLLQALPRFAQKPVAVHTKKDRAIAASLTEYLSRAVYKTSPLSRFTTVSLWRVSKKNDPEPAEEMSDLLSAPKSVITPNVELLPLLYDVLLGEPAFYGSLPVRLNPSFQQTPLPEDPATIVNQWLYFDGQQESFQQMQPNAATDFVLKCLLENQGQLPFFDLLHRLEQRIDSSVEQLQALIFDLLDFGLLEWRLPEQGLSPGWCGALYNYLGHQPSAPLLTETAFLLQWLRTVARTLPFQTVEEAQIAQCEAVAQVKRFFEKYHSAAPEIRAEQVFFEDVEQSVQVNLPPAAVESLVADLRQCWQQRELHLQPPFRARLFLFARKVLAAGGEMDFLPFCQQFLEQENQGSMEEEAVKIPLYRGKIGALLQVFEEKGEYKAVVNGLFPGGGKLFARWLHLFQADVRERLEDWNESAPFPWQGWSNANFQPPLSLTDLAVPGGRTRPLPGGTSQSLSDFKLRWSELGIPRLIHGRTGDCLRCTDLGLEALETRPPAMQVLWHLTVPFVSKEILMSDSNGQREAPWGWCRPRIMERSLVLQRQMWGVRPDLWKKWVMFQGDDADFFLLICPVLSEMEVPRQFFARFLETKAKPQAVDLNNPALVSLFQKMLRNGQGMLVLTEMLPLPEQVVVVQEGHRASEFVVELEV